MEIYMIFFDFIVDVYLLICGFALIYCSFAVSFSTIMRFVFRTFASSWLRSNPLITPLPASKFLLNSGNENVSITSAPSQGNRWLAIANTDWPPRAPLLVAIRKTGLLLKSLRPFIRDTQSVMFL